MSFIPQLFIASLLCCGLLVCLGEDPYVSFDWTVSYLTASPLGVNQQVIAVNGQFPGPVLNVTTNWNVIINVKNNLDEPLLITWAGVQQRKNAWQDGVSGTNCPIPAGWNWTYQFQVKDQIGSFFYFPSLNFQRASGGYGGITINNRDIIPIPFGTPDGDISLLISDWYTKSHKDLRKQLDDGPDLGVPDGVLINGLGPFRYDQAVVPENIPFLIVNVEPGKTYRLRVSNVGISTSLNFRIQNHNLVLVETEGSYTVQQNYTDMDIHVGQSYSFLVTMDQNASSDYYIVASPRFVNSSAWAGVKGVAVLHYANSQGPVSGPLPDPPNELDTSYSMNQARSIRWNVTASGARPNPQGSFRYGEITVTDVYVILNTPPQLINGKWRTTLNGISYFTPSTPLMHAQQFDVLGVYKVDFPNMPMNRPAKLDTSLINATFKGFIEIIFQNNDTVIKSYHLDGYAFFVVGMDYGVWTENSRGIYNKWDGVARCTTHVFPGAWTAILVSLDNPGIWNLRAENLNSWYLGQEAYMSVVNPEIDKSAVPMPQNLIYCGVLSYLQRDQSRRFDYSVASKVTVTIRKAFLVVLSSLVGHLVSRKRGSLHCRTKRTIMKKKIKDCDSQQRLMAWGRKHADCTRILDSSQQRCHPSLIYKQSSKPSICKAFIPFKGLKKCLVLSYKRSSTVNIVLDKTWGSIGSCYEMKLKFEASSSTLCVVLVSGIEENCYELKFEVEASSSTLCLIFGGGIEDNKIEDQNRPS